MSESLDALAYFSIITGLIQLLLLSLIGILAFKLYRIEVCLFPLPQEECNTTPLLSV